MTNDANGKVSKQKSSFSLRSFLLTGVVAFCAHRLYHKSTIYEKPFSKSDFQSTKYNIKEIPTTYYHVGRIAEVLPTVRLP
jgi:hypothetical protein